MRSCRRMTIAAATGGLTVLQTRTRHSATGSCVVDAAEPRPKLRLVFTCHLAAKQRVWTTRPRSGLLEHPVRVWVPNVLPVHGRGTINVTNDIVRLCVRLLETAGSGPRIAHAT